jgi:hypothetical protein
MAEPSVAIIKAGMINTVLMDVPSLSDESRQLSAEDADAG